MEKVNLISASTNTDTQRNEGDWKSGCPDSVEGLLAHVAGVTKSQWNDEESRQCSQAICDMAWESVKEPKILKKLLKALSDVEKVRQDVVQRTLEQYVITDTKELSLEFLYFWSHVMDISQIGKTLLGKQLDCLINSLSLTIKGLLEKYKNELKSVSTETQLHMHSSIKLAIQIFQNFKLLSEGASVSAVLLNFRKTLLDVLSCSRVSKDCILLTGTALGFQLCLEKCESKVVQSFLDLYQAVDCCGSESKPEPSEKSTDEQSFTTLGQLALITGILSCTNSKHVVQAVTGKFTDNPKECLQMSFFVWLFNEILELCSRRQWHFHAFSSLELWYSKATKYAGTLLVDRPICDQDQQTVNLFRGNCPVMKATLELIWTQIDSPIDGVSECIMHVYKMLLALHVKVSPEEDGSAPDTLGVNRRYSKTLDAILCTLLQMSWHVKGKHALIAALLKYVPFTTLLSKEPGMGEDLLDCMATNFLAPSATQLFTGILQNADLKHENVQAKIIAWILEGNIHKNSLLKLNVSRLWLPVCAKFSLVVFKKVLKYTEDGLSRNSDCLAINSNCSIKISSRDSLLYSLISLLKCARANHMTVEFPMDLLKEALRHADDDLRIDAFAFVCYTPKKSELLSDMEISLLAASLPDNMNMDNAPFRQELQSHLRAVLVRGRDSTLANLVTKKQDLANKTITFLNWFFELCVDSLHPGSSYQRLKTALDWIGVVFDTLTYQPHRHQKKGNTPQNVGKLIDAAHEQGKLLFHTDKVAGALLSCLLHGTDEIRELAGVILHEYMPWPLPTENLSDTSTTSSQLLVSALDLCNNPKAYKSDGGALLIKLIFSNLVISGGKYFDMKILDSGKHTVTIQNKAEGTDVTPALYFINQLLNLLQQSLKTSKSNVLQAATSLPGHGLIFAIQRCLTECKCIFEPRSKWRDCIVELLGVSTELLKVVLEVLGGSLQGKDTTPSFEQMGISVQQTIANCLGDQTLGPGSHTILTCPQQMVMTWCWINVRQISILLGRLVDSLPIGADGLIHYEEIQSIADTFIGVLTGCRHRGAIEGCNVGFMKFCVKLLNNEDDQLRHIPSVLLVEIINKVRNVGSKASVTRRSAGLPLIIQSIVASEGKTKRDNLLRQSVEELVKIVVEPVHEKQDQRKDLPQVHALNILKAVFRESSIANNAQPYVGTATIHAIDGFASPIWGIRNGAMQLFSTLLQRMLGQKKTKDDHINTMTLQEFFLHYPILKPYLLKQLASGVSSLQSNQLSLNPSLYPILTIVSKLASGVTEFDALEDLRVMVASLEGSAIQGVRELAAAALPALIPKQDILSFVTGLAKSLPSCQEDSYSQNVLHGKVLQVDRLLQHLQPDTLSDELVCTLAEVIYSRTRGLVESNPCYIGRAACIQLLRNTHEKTNVPYTKELIKVLYLELQVIRLRKAEDVVLIGYDQYIKQLVNWYLSMKMETSDILEELLLSENQDLVLYCLQSFRKCSRSTYNYEDGQVPWSRIQNLLLKMVLSSEIPWDNLCEAFECLIGIYDIVKDCFYTESKQTVHTTWKKLAVLLEKERNSQIAGYSLLVMGTLMKTYMRSFLSEEVEEFCDMLSSCSEPTCAEHLRSKSAHALQITGVDILLNMREKHQSETKKYAENLLKVVKTTELLLTDENSDIRYMAASFVTSSMARDGSVSASVVHPNVALEYLPRWTIHCDQVALVQLLLNYMSNECALVTILEQETKENVDDIFAPEEINPYREAVVLLDLHTGFGGMNNEDLIPDKDLQVVVKNECKNIAKELSDANSLLSKVCKSSLNATCNKSVYDAIWSCLQRCTICLRLRDQSKDSDAALQQALKTLIAVPFLHPKLQVKLDALCSMT